MDMTALIGAAGVALSALTAALTLWRKLQKTKNQGLAVAKELEQIKDAKKVGVDFLAEKLNVSHAQAYRLAKKTDSPFQLEHVASVGKRWRAKTSSVSEWMRKEK